MPASVARLTLLCILALAGLTTGVAAETGELPAQKLPKLVPLKRAIRYPDAALRAGLEGKVIAAFDLTADGRVTNSAVIYSDDSLFSGYVKEFLSEMRFDLGERPTPEPHPVRYRLGFVFCLPPSDLDERFAVSIAEPIVVKASRLPRSPIRNLPGPGVAGPCVTR